MTRAGRKLDEGSSLPETLRAPALQPGDTVAVVAPASSPTEEQLASGVEALHAAGYRTRMYRDLCRPRGYLSGGDERRSEEFNTALADPDVAAIVAARGGYGVARILDKIDYGLVRQRPKIIAGYSDLTALHVAIARETGLVTFHSPMAIDGLGPGGRCGASAEAFRRAVSGEQAEGWQIDATPWHGVPTCITPGVAQGRLLGGNLAVLCGLIGTRFDLDPTGAILLLEDTGEVPYRVDRMLAQLRLSGRFDAVAGVALGYFSECDAMAGKPSLELHEVFADYFAGRSVPVAAGFPVGHQLPNLTLPHGAMCELDAGAGRLTVLENPVRRPNHV